GVRLVEPAEAERRRSAFGVLDDPVEIGSVLIISHQAAVCCGRRLVLLATMVGEGRAVYRCSGLGVALVAEGPEGETGRQRRRCERPGQVAMQMGEEGPVQVHRVTVAGQGIDQCALTVQGDDHWWPVPGTAAGPGKDLWEQGQVRGIHLEIEPAGCLGPGPGD